MQRLHSPSGILEVLVGGQTQDPEGGEGGSSEVSGL